MDSATDKKSEVQSTLNNEPQAVVVRRESERDLVVWTAPARIFKKHSKKFYITTFSMAGIVSIIIFLAEGIMPVILIVSLVFLYYVLATVQPENIEYKITNKGIKIAGKGTPWNNIVRFWFSTKSGSEVLNFDISTVPGRMELVINPEIKDILKREISAYVPYEEASPSALDKVTSWVSKKLPENE
jgi:hypothetical protein